MQELIKDSRNIPPSNQTLPLVLKSFHVFAGAKRTQLG